jgi:Zn-dependent protease
MRTPIVHARPLPSLRMPGLDLSLPAGVVLVFALLGATFALRLLPAALPDSGTGVHVGGALALMLLFGGCLVLHERAHALAARRLGVAIRPVLDGVWGGYEIAGGRRPDAGDEAMIASAGPAMSVLLAAALGAAGLALAPLAPAPAVVVLYLSMLNGVFGAFSMLPALPLDGGRVLRALAAGSSGSVDRGTRMAARIGNFIAAVLVVLGLWLAARHGYLLAGAWIFLAGWLLHGGAVAASVRLGGAEARQAVS